MGYPSWKIAEACELVDTESIIHYGRAKRERVIELANWPPGKHNEMTLFEAQTPAHYS